MTHILIVSANFYTDISAELEAGAVAELEARGCTHELIHVPGALEIPAAIGFALYPETYDGFVALGCVIRGETTHYETVCDQSARGLMDIAIHQDAAIGNGILTVENDDQAWARAKRDQGNKGQGAVAACLRMIELKQKFGVSL